MKRYTAALALMATSLSSLPAAAQTPPVRTPADVERELSAMQPAQLDAFCTNLGIQGAPAAGIQEARTSEYRICAANGQRNSALMSFRATVLGGQLTPVCSVLGAQSVEIGQDGTTLNVDNTVSGVLAIEGAQIKYIELPSQNVLGTGNLVTIGFADRVRLGGLINQTQAMRDLGIYGVLSCPSDLVSLTGVTVTPRAPGQ